MTESEELDLVVRMGWDGTGFQNGVSNTNRQMRVLQSEFAASAAAMGGMADSTDRLRLQSNHLNSMIELQQNKVAQLRAAYERSVQEKGADARATQELLIKLNQARAALSNFENQLGDVNQRLEESTQQSEEAANTWGQWSEKLGGLFAGIGAASGAVGLSFAAIGTGIAGVGIAVADSEKALSKLQAQTALTEEETAELGAIAKSVFKDGWGEATDEAYQAVSVLRRSLGEMTEQEMQEVTKGALAIKEAFEVEVADTAKVVKTLTDNFDDLSKTQALDIITTGFQNGLDYSGDFLDTLNEYSVYFRDMGFSATEFLSILDEGAKNGAFNLDKVADSIKELGIRVTDGSDGTKAAFEAAGLNADQMAQKFSKGGESAKSAFFETITALEGIKDPVARSNAAIGLFGTQFEDLRESAVFSLKNVQNELFETENATKQMADDLHDNLGTKFEAIWRTIKTSVTDEGGSLHQPLSDFADWTTAHLPQIEAAIAGTMDVMVTAFHGVADAIQWVSANMDIILPVISTLTTAFAAHQVMGFVSGLKEVGTTLDMIKSGFSALSKTFMANPWALAIGALVTAAVAIYTNWDQISAFLSEVWNSIVTVASTVWGSIRDFFTGLWGSITATVTTAWQAITSAVQAGWDAIVNLFSSVWGFLESIVTAGWEIISTIFGAYLDTIGAVISGAWEVIKTIFSTAFLVIYDLVTGNWDEIGQVFSAAGAKLWSIITGVWDTIKSIWSGALVTVASILDAAWEGIKAVWNAALDGLVSILKTSWEWIKGIVVAGITAVRDFFVNGWEGIKSAFTNSWTAIKSGVSSGMTAVWNTITRIWDGIVDFITSFPSKALQWGKDFIQGFINGIRGMISSAIDSVTGFFDDILQSAKDTLGIRSPSRVMKQYGQWVAEGFQIGMDDNKDKPIKSAEIMAKAVSDAVGKALNSLNLELQISRAELEVYSKTLGTTAADATKRMQAELAVLNVEYSSSAEKLEVLWDAYNRMVAAKGEASEEANKLYLEILKEQKAQADLAEQIRDTNDVLTAQGEKFADVEQKVADTVKKYRDEMAKAYEDYQGKVSAANKKIVDDIEKETKAYVTAVESRTKSLLSSTGGLFDAFNKKNVSGDQLLENLRGQVEGMGEWRYNIAALAKRGIDEGLLKELREMGPKAGGEIAALNGMTDQQLREYSALWKMKNREAREQAVSELEGLKKDTDKKVKELRAQHNAELTKLRNDWIGRTNEIRSNTNETFDQLKQDGAQFGTQFVQSIGNAIQAAMPSLLDQIRDVTTGLSTAIGSMFGDLGVLGPMIPPFGGIGDLFRNIPGLADGGTVTRAGLTLVGERGPELLNLPSASQVVPLNRVSGGATGDINITVQINSPVYGVEDLNQAIADGVRTQAIPILIEQTRQAARARR